jgi:predicted TIM-barrel fold metal-dependent hydrolase
MIVDVDSHWELGQTAPGEHPLEPWLDRLPTGIDLLAFAVAGDLLASLPPDRRPAPAELLPGLVQAAKARGGPVMLHPKHHSGADERIAWMDRIGIDHCLVNPGGYWQMLPFVPADERPAAVRRCNDFLAEQLSPGAGRLHSVAVLDWSSPDAAVAELERCRQLGARAFFLATDQGQPAGGIAPGHPVWDRLWAAAVRNGMVAVIHVGNTSAGFGAWGDVGWDLPGGAPAGVLGRLANTQRAMGAQNLIASMLYGGVFARFPELTVLLEEMRVNWLPPFVETLTRQSADSPIMGDWPWPVSGGEMLRRNLRATPLPGFGDTDALDVLRALPGMVVFSSDYPHLEGNAEPVDLYRPELDALDAELRAAFLGGNMAECYARTGDPLPAAC